MISNRPLSKSYIRNYKSLFARGNVADHCKPCTVCNNRAVFPAQGSAGKNIFFSAPDNCFECILRLRRRQKTDHNARQKVFHQHEVMFELLYKKVNEIIDVNEEEFNFCRTLFTPRKL